MNVFAVAWLNNQEWFFNFLWSYLWLHLQGFGCLNNEVIGVPHLLLLMALSWVILLLLCWLLITFFPNRLWCMKTYISSTLFPALAVLQLVKINLSSLVFWMRNHNIYRLYVMWTMGRNSFCANTTEMQIHIGMYVDPFCRICAPSFSYMHINSFTKVSSVNRYFDIFLNVWG